MLLKKNSHVKIQTSELLERGNYGIGTRFSDQHAFQQGLVLIGQGIRALN